MSLEQYVCVTGNALGMTLLGPWPKLATVTGYNRNGTYTLFIEGRNWFYTSELVRPAFDFCPVCKSQFEGHTARNLPLHHVGKKVCYGSFMPVVLPTQENQSQ